MTDDMMNLRTLVEKTPDADLLREIAESEAKRPPIPTESGHPIRSKAAT